MTMKQMPSNFDVSVKNGVNVASEWHPAGGYVVWSTEKSQSYPSMNILELHDAGVVRIPDRPRILHVIPAGRAHHLMHGFGFWRRSSADLLFIRIEEPEFLSTRYLMMVPLRAPIGYQEEIFWICPRCRSEIGNQQFRSQVGQFQEFWHLATDAVRMFNDSESTHTCDKCGEVHPLGYGIYPEKDSEAEAAARFVW
ncbi:cupin domain-containing protein [Burkholderia cepacia]|uniref:hypothetical protein n=1 Tax=Burkholderia cepacia TaxID=292 RepID=UPI002AB68666|nr:hypothetical protein [Burkholderia cepacia]